MVQKLVGIDGLDLEIPISQHMAFYRYEDRPGVIGTIGGLLGEAGVNIAGMQVARDDEQGQALVALTLDSAVPADLAEQVMSQVGVDQFRIVELD